MRNIITALLAALFIAGVAQAKSRNVWGTYGTGSNLESTEVQGHYRANGTYVEPYYRTKPNDTVNDNYNTSGNYNPWNNKVGKEKVSDWNN